MRKPVIFLIGVLVAAIGWIFLKNYKMDSLTEVAVLSKSTAETDPTTAGSHMDEPKSSPLNSITSTVKQWLNPSPDPSTSVGGSSFAGKADQVIRIATFNIDAFNETKSHKPRVMNVLSRIARQFDVIAIQEIQADVDDIIPRLVDLMNKSGQRYDYAIGPRLGPVGAQEQYAFIFDGQSVLLDRAELYTVDDQDDLLLREPFVGWFRAVGPDKTEAFTFSLVNIRVDPTNADTERKVLDDVVHAVRDDGRQEDDVIILGDFRAAARELGDLDQLSDVSYAVSQIPTNTHGDQSWSNIVVQKNSTIEFTGRGGVFDFLREYNMNLEEAAEVSDHLPVWAEFSIYEGGQAGRIAELPAGAPSQATLKR
ncbi:MAG: endonuclease/exonuclease/phosphatase family protein [Pirellulaceae bacterium]|nr:endonuclease/exonuclease/phosphatase family protein [Pirellulaceae bacterium]